MNDPTIAEPGPHRPAAPSRPVLLAQSAVALVRTLRPHQWIKNLFVAAPLVFAQKLGEPEHVVRAGLAVLAFCALSGAVYAFNDVRDVEADRRHPTKRRRPVAAGELSERAALVWSGVLVAGTLAASLLLGARFAVIAAAYVVQNAAYTVWLKRVAFVDVALIAAGFLLRVLAGAAAISVPSSGWLLLCTSLLALLLGFGKRAHELAWAERTGRKATRAALAGYHPGVLRIAMFALTAATCGAFVAYTLDDVTIAHFRTSRLVYSAPLVALAVVRYLGLALWSRRDEPPTEAMLRDPWFLLLVVGAAGVMLHAIYS